MTIAKRFVRGSSLAMGILAFCPAFGAAGWTVSTQIIEVNQQPALGIGSALVFIETELTSNPSSCSYQKGFYFAVSDDRQKRMFAMLLAAQMSGRSIKIYTSGTCHNPWGYAELDGLVVI